jgi:hypothetical protein
LFEDLHAYEGFWRLLDSRQGDVVEVAAVGSSLADVYSPVDNQAVLAQAEDLGVAGIGPPVTGRRG